MNTPTAELELVLIHLQRTIELAPLFQWTAEEIESLKLAKRLLIDGRKLHLERRERITHVEPQIQA